MRNFNIVLKLKPWHFITDNAFIFNSFFNFQRWFFCHFNILRVQKLNVIWLLLRRCWRVTWLFEWGKMLKLKIVGSVLLLLAIKKRLTHGQCLGYFKFDFVGLKLLLNLNCPCSLVWLHNWVKDSFYRSYLGVEFSNLTFHILLFTMRRWLDNRSITCLDWLKWFDFLKVYASRLVKAFVSILIKPYWSMTVDCSAVDLWPWLVGRCSFLAQAASLVERIN